MTEIKIKENVYKVAFNMQTAIAYERTTNKNPLDLTQFQEGKIENVLVLGYCMILTSNDPESVPAYEEYISSFDTFSKVSEIANIVSAELMAFFGLTEADIKKASSKGGKSQKTDNRS